MHEVKVPSVGESISEVQIAQWLKQEGAWVAKDENLVDLETEKASVQVPAPISGYVRNIRKQAEEFASVGDVICDLEPAAAPAGNGASASAPTGKQEAISTPAGQTSKDAPRVMPAAQRLLDEQQLSASQVQATGPRRSRAQRRCVAGNLECKTCSDSAQSDTNLGDNRPLHCDERIHEVQRPDGRSQTAKHDPPYYRR